MGVCVSVAFSVTDALLVGLWLFVSDVVLDSDGVVEADTDCSDESENDTFPVAEAEASDVGDVDAVGPEAESETDGSVGVH